MQITKIKKLKNGLYQIHIDNGTSEEKFRLSEDFLIKNNIYSNKKLTEEEYKLLYTLANYSKIYTQALNYISYKMRTEQEVSTYLDDKECDNTYKAEIIQKLKLLNYINDQLYAELFLKQQLEFNKKGPNWIRTELRKKGIDLKLIDQVMKTVSTLSIQENIQKLIQYYDKMNKKKSIRKLKETATKNLLIKGYDYEDIKHEMNRYNFDGSVDELQLLNKQLQKTYTKYQRKYSGHELKSRVIKALMNKGFNYDDIESEYSKIELEDFYV